MSRWVILSFLVILVTCSRPEVAPAPKSSHLESPKLEPTPPIPKPVWEPVAAPAPPILPRVTEVVKLSVESRPKPSRSPEKPMVRLVPGSKQEEFSFIYEKTMVAGVPRPVTVAIGLREKPLSGFSAATAVIPHARGYTVQLRGEPAEDFKIEPSELKTDSPAPGQTAYLEFQVTPKTAGVKNLHYKILLHDVDSLFGRYLKEMHGTVTITTTWQSWKYRVKATWDQISWGSIVTTIASGLFGFFTEKYLGKRRVKKREKSHS